MFLLLALQVVFYKARVEFYRCLTICQQKQKKVISTSWYLLALLKRAMVIKENISCTSPLLFCTTVEIKIAKRFLEIVSRNFDSTHPYHDISNSKQLMLSYSCMSNMKSQIMSHNRKMLEEEITFIKLCNCRGKYVVDGKYLKSLIFFERVQTY